MSFRMRILALVPRLPSGPAARSRLLCVLALAAFLATPGFMVAAAAQVPAEEKGLPPFRVFLLDGTSLVTYGEHARVDDKLVFSVQVGSGPQARLQLLTLPVTSVDVERTEEYAAAIRYRRYAATRGEADYAHLTADVADAIDRMAKTKDVAERLRIAEAISRAVSDWPRAHYGYRADDVRQIAALLEETVSELRAATGSTDFSLDFVAATIPPDVEILPPPTPAEAIAAVLGAARHVDVPAERLSLLRTVVAYVDEAGDYLPRDARKSLESLERQARRTLSAELRVETAYARLARRIVNGVESRARQGDVKAVLRAFDDLARDDEKLGRKRPDQVAAVRAALDAQLETARRVRLEKDQWLARTAACAPYRSAVMSILSSFGRSTRDLEEIKTLSGPGLNSLGHLWSRAAVAASRAAAINPPPDMVPIHASLVTALELAKQAATARQEAVRNNDMKAAWNASSAAAGALMMVSKVRADIEAFFREPGSR